MKTEEVKLGCKEEKTKVAAKYRAKCNFILIVLMAEFRSEVWSGRLRELARK